MSNELVTFGRVPKSTMEESQKIPGKLWVTNDPQNDNNPDNLAEAYVDDTSNRRMKITDRDLVNRVGELESAKAITDPEIEEIIRSVGSDPASPLNFKNNIMFVDSTITISQPNAPVIPVINLVTDSEIPNLETPYNLIIVSYPTISGYAYGNAPINSIVVNLNGTPIGLIVTSIIKGLYFTESSYCFMEGTYVFRLTINSGSPHITINNIYVFPKRNLLVDEQGNTISNQNAPIISIVDPLISSENYIFGEGTSDSLSYIDTLYGAYLIARTNTGSDTPSRNGWRTDITISESLQQFVSKYMSILDLNDITLSLQSGISYRGGNPSSKSILTQTYLRIKLTNSGTKFYADLYVPNNGMGNCDKKLVFFLPKF